MSRSFAWTVGRVRWAVVFAGLLLMGALGRTLHAQPSALRVDRVALTVDDADRALPFYRDLLNFAVEQDTVVQGADVARMLGVFGARIRVVTLRLGREEIALYEYQSPEGRPRPPDAKSNDHAFQHVALVVRDMEPAYDRLQQYGVAHVSPAPQRLPDWNPNAGGIEAFYFQDPFGNTLELLEFPSDKGAERWHRSTDRLFLGIDHTAIVVADTEASLRFYRDALGFRVVGQSTNYGPEQERLNRVFGARLAITALRAPGGGMGVEFLEYQSPTTGRPFPVDTRANDAWHWHIRLYAEAPGPLIRSLLDAGTGFVSPGLQRLDPPALGMAAGALLRDPTGHALLVASPDMP